MSSQKLTISDVARAAGVSKATAGFVLSNRKDVRVAEGTRTRVHEVARQIGYRRSGVATALSVGRIYTVGVVVQADVRAVHSLHGINVYARDVIAALTWACSKQNLRLTTILVRSNGAVTAEEIADGRVDGLVLVSVSDEALARALFSTGFPSVTIGSGYSERRVFVNEAAGIRDAVNHLHQLGHRDIAFVGYDDERAHHLAALERCDAYTESMQALNLTPRYLEERDSITVMKQPVQRPSGWVCFNDLLACSLLQNAGRLGLRVPTDMSVVGFDDTLFAEMAWPPLTTVANPIEKQAEAAIALLQSRWHGTDDELPAPLLPRLVVRESTGPPPPP